VLRTRLTLRPGRPGTKRLLAFFGERLLRVRYRYDDERHIRCTTVELIVDQRDLHAPTNTTDSIYQAWTCAEHVRSLPMTNEQRRATIRTALAPYRGGRFSTKAAAPSGMLYFTDERGQSFFIGGLNHNHAQHVTDALNATLELLNPEHYTG